MLESLPHQWMKSDNFNGLYLANRSNPFAIDEMTFTLFWSPHHGGRLPEQNNRESVNSSTPRESLAAFAHTSWSPPKSVYPRPPYDLRATPLPALEECGAHENAMITMLGAVSEHELGKGMPVPIGTQHGDALKMLAMTGGSVLSMEEFLSEDWHTPRTTCLDGRAPSGSADVASLA
jgi:hypothetical protein